MKKAILSLVILSTLNAFSLTKSVCQTSLQFLRERVGHFLEEGGIIEKQETIDQMPGNSGKEIEKRKKAYQERQYFVEKFKYPGSLSEMHKEVSVRFQYPQIPISMFGSMIFDTKELPIDKNQIILRRLNSLLIASDLSQITLETPSDNNYHLNINLLSYMNWAISGNVDADFLGILKSKASAAVQKTFSEKKIMSVAYGHFTNRLAQLFEKVNTTHKIDHIRDFSPLYEIWSLHSVSNDRINAKFIVANFNALLIDESDDAILLGDENAKTISEINVKIPFLKAQGKVESDWVQKSEIGNQGRNVSLYFDNNPNFIGIPTAKSILVTWDEISQHVGNEVYYDGGNFLTINDINSSDPVVKVGIYLPSSDHKFLLDAKLVGSTTTQIRPEDAFIKEVRIANIYPNSMDKSDENIYYLPISVILDKAKIASTPSIDEIITIDRAFKIFYKKSCTIGDTQKFLEKTYPLLIRLQTGTAVYKSATHSTTNNDGATWTLEFLTTKEVVNLDLLKIDFGTPQLEKFQNTLKGNSNKPIKDSTNPRKWTLTTSAPLLPNSMNFGKDASATFTFRVIESSTALPLIRESKIPSFPLHYQTTTPLEMEIVKENINELNEFIPNDLKLSNGKIAKTILQDRSTSDSTRLAIYNELLGTQVIKKSGNTFILKLSSKKE